MKSGNIQKRDFLVSDIQMASEMWTYLCQKRFRIQTFSLEGLIKRQMSAFGTFNDQTGLGHTNTGRAWNLDPS